MSEKQPTHADLMREIEELRKQVKELGPKEVPVPYPYPVYPSPWYPAYPNPWGPWFTYTCESGTNANPIGGTFC